MTAGSPSAGKLHWEDFIAGAVADYGPYLVTREEVIEFASQFDPQPMHLDEEAARHSMLNGLAASGFHTCGILMRLITDGFVNKSASLGSPGVDDIKWRAPVRPGDELRVRTTITETRASNSRPGMGFVKFRFEVLNAQDTCVMTLVSSLMVRRRQPGAAPAPATGTEG
jgi:acyl dehydratase